MTNDKFRELCKKVLIPLFGDLARAQFIEFRRTLDILAEEIVRLSNRIDRLATLIGSRDDDADY